MKTMELHDELCRALTLVGGVAVDALQSSEEKRADLYFSSFGAVAEVKSITTDRGETESVKARTGEIINDWARRGVGTAVQGEARFDLADLDPRVAEDILMNVGGRVRREISAANAQIKATAAALGLDKPLGVCLFVQPSHFGTHNGVIATVAQRVLASGTCSALDSIAILGVPVDDVMQRDFTEAQYLFTLGNQIGLCRSSSRNSSPKAGYATMRNARVPRPPFQKGPWRNSKNDFWSHGQLAVVEAPLAIA